MDAYTAAFIISKLLEAGLTMKQIMDAGDEAGLFPQELKDRIVDDLAVTWAEWQAKRAAE